MIPELRTFAATRYVQPFREGGSVPAVVETEGEGLFVTKFRGAGQGAKALVAELVVGLFAQLLGLPIPELALIEISSTFGRQEPDPEIQDILRGSVGTNVGLRYLEGAFNFAPAAAGALIDPDFAADLVWLDAWLTNPDRTHRNPNLLIQERRPWLIDHGAALYAHHHWAAVDEARARTPFPLIRDHVLLGLSGSIEEADARHAPRLDEATIRGVLDEVPESLLLASPVGPEFASAEEARDRYLRYLLTRLEEPRAWVAEAIRAREQIRSASPSVRPARR